MIRFFATLIAAVTLAGSSALAKESASDAKNFVDSVAAEVLKIVKDDSADKDAKAKKIETLFEQKVDINFVAKFVLGKNWRDASEKQRTDYIAAYKPFILKNYASRLTRYSGQTYTLKNPRSDGDSSMVTMEIVDPNGQNVVVDYRLSANGNGSYKILDIIVEGVSLLTTQRSEFNAIVDRKGVDGLIEALKKQVAKK